MTDRRVVVTGTGVVSPLGDSRGSLHTALCEQRTGLKPLELFDAPYLESLTAGEISDFNPVNYLGKRNLRPLNRTAQLLASTAGLALQDSGWTPEHLETEIAGLVVGTTFCSVRTISEFDCRALKEGPSRTSPLDFANTVINAAAGQAAIWHKLHGVNSTISAGITSGLEAISYAAGLIREGHERAILAGGVEEMCTESLLGFQRAGLLSGVDSGSDDGIHLAEGCGLLMLEEHDFAVSRGATILAEVRGHGSRFDCNLDEEDADSLAETITRTIEDAVVQSGLSFDSIDAACLSANGSDLLDRAESAAINRLFSELLLTAPKQLLGEALGASGALQAIALIEALATGVLPGVPRGMQHESETVRLAESNRDVAGSHGLVNAVGFDRNCSALIVSKA